MPVSDSTALPPISPPPTVKTRAAVAARLERMRTMAEEGYSSPQIAAALGVAKQTCYMNMRRAGIVARADSIVRKTRHLDANRIVEQMTIQAENLCADTDLIEFSKLDTAKLPQWVRSLEASRTALVAFIRQLKEQLL